jgi:outer membrane protein OmpU
MKHVLLATTALTMSAGFAAADISMSGKANAGFSNTTTGGAEVNRASSGIDLNISASITTDNGVTLTVADDFGGGELIDYDDDYAVEAQTSDLDQPAITLSMGGSSVTFDPDSIDDLYDDDQSGDVQISTSVMGFTINYVMSNDTDDDATRDPTSTGAITAAGAEGTTTTGTNSYRLDYSAGDLAFAIAGTDSGDAGENEAMKWKATYSLGDMTLGIEMNNNGDLEDTTTGSISYAVGNGLSVTLSADDNDDWDASVSWSAGGVSVSYVTDEESAFEAHATYDLGGGAKVFAATTDANDFSALGVEFTF